jgi:eukaryotic-like serine/threonine-protein kinase
VTTASNNGGDAASSPADPTHTGEPPTGSTDAPPPLIRPAAATAVRDRQRYQIIGEHGRGGLGRVSRAHDTELGRDIAIKELLSRERLNEVRFHREVLITARLEHPGIVPVYEAGRWPDGTPFYAMKLVSGRSLRELIAQRPKIADRIGLLHHVIAVADAIAYAHDRHVLHRDLKPSNVIVGEFGETIVIDWGLAKDLRASDDSAPGAGASGSGRDDDVTSAGAVLGTPAYMAPEQARGEQVDKRADVFAIGAMLWQLCADQKTPPADTRERDRMLHRAGIDDDLAAILAKATDPDPERRYRDAASLAADLKAFKSGARIAARSYSVYAALAHWTRRHRTLAISAIAFVVLLVASVTALAVLYRSSSQNARTARERLIQSYVEQGRRLLLDGEYLRALPYLAEAYAQGDRSTTVRFLLARAQRLTGAQLSMHSHATFARAVAFRPDGHHVLSVSDDGDGAIWEASTGRVVATLSGQPGVPHFVKISRDGAFAAIPSADGLIVWDGASTRTFGPGGPSHIAIDASGRRIAIELGGELSVWSTSGEPLWTASIKTATVQLGWSGDAIAVVGLDQLARIVDPHNVVQLATTGLVGTITVGTSGTIATVSDRVIELWNAAGARLGRSESRTPITALSFSPDSTRIAIGSEDGFVRLYDTASWTLLGELVGHRGRVQSIEFSRDGRLLATAAADLKVRIWSVDDQRPIATLLGARERHVIAALRFDAAGKRLIAPTQDGAIRVFAATDPDVEASVDAEEPITFGQLLDGGLRFTTTGWHKFRIWSNAGAELGHLDVPVGAQTVLSPDGTKVVNLRPNDSEDTMEAEIRDATTNAVLAQLPGTRTAQWAAFDHASERVVIGSRDHTAAVWSVRGQHLATLRGHSRQVLMAVFSPDDRRIATASSDRTVRIWDAASGRELGKVTTAGSVDSVCFDATGAQVLAGGADRTARLWDATTLSLIRSFEHPSNLRYVAISADGSLVAGAAIDGTVSVWDPMTSSLLAEFRHAASATAAAFSANADRLFTTSSDHRAKLWRLGLENRPPASVTAFVRCHVPYQLVETRLETATPTCSND